MKPAWAHFAKFFGFLTACILLTSCDDAPKTPVETAPQADPNTLTRALYSAQIKLDPHFATISADAALVRDLFTGLMGFDVRGNVVPAIAQQWFTEDGKSWLFLLDEWAKWSNDEPVVAQDFVASWQRLADPKNGSKLSPYLSHMGVKNAKTVLAGILPVSELGVSALNPHSLKIELERANFELPKMLAHSALLPTYQGKPPAASPALISNGEYVVQALSEQTLRLQAVDSTPFFANVQYQLITTAQNPDGFDLLENPLPNHKQNVVALPRQCSYFYEFNFADPMLQNKAVRKVIKTLIGTMNVQRQFGMPSDSVLPNAMQHASESAWQPTVIEPLLSQAGITPQNPLRLTLSYDSRGKHPQIADAMVRALGQSDLVKITPQPLEWQALLAHREKGDFQLIRSGWCADFPDPAQFVSQFHSQSRDNKSGYQNAEVDRLIEQLIYKKLSEADRLQIAQNIDQLLKNDIAVLPLFQYQRRVAVNRSIAGVDPHNASEVIYSKDLSRIQLSEEQNEPTDRTTTP